MEVLKLRKHPERDLQNKIIHKLRIRGWLVREMNASENMCGWPDLYITHKKYGYRWVEVKLPMMVGSRFTPAQMEWFPKLCANGTHIWVLTSDSDTELDKLFSKQNMMAHLMMYGL